MDGLAAQAAIAIDNARLFQAAERANEGLEKRVVERTAELEHAHEALRHAQKMEAIGQLTGGVAHDFNNLLTVIRGSADILSRPNLSEEKRARYVDAIAQTADRAARLTSQLLAFARRQALEPVVFDVVERVKAETEMLRPVMGSRIQVVVDAECDPCHVEADPNQFETAVLNMSVNARDAMDGEGQLTISVGAVEGVPASHGQSPMAGEFVAISISDTGSGVDADKIDRIFEPFFTTKGVGHGTGLGLSQVFGFAKQSGGDIRVSNNEAGGATFTLYLPKAEHDISVVTGEAQPHEADRSARGSVLVVEDNADVGAFASDLLEELGYQSMWVPDAQAALDYLSSGRSNIDVVFSDVVMPGMSGVDLAKEVRLRLPRMPIVLTSGYSHIIAEEGTHGFTLLRKPYSVDGVTKALQEAIAQAA
jgi:signal transduction histidine kinase/ActR/RegA family two-component response regulator